MKYFGHNIINPYRSHTPRGFYDPIKGHTGIDIDTPENTRLGLPVKLKVFDVVRQTQMGLTLYLQDKSGNILVFSHLNKTLFEVGDEVPENAVFALSGNTGTATTGPHLHFEVISSKPEDKIMTRSLNGIDGYNIDPVNYLDSLEAHWSDESMDWAIEHGIIKEAHDPESNVKWGEFVVVIHNLAKKIMSWVKK